MSRKTRNIPLLDWLWRNLGVIAVVILVVIGLMWAVGSKGGGKHSTNPAAPSRSRSTDQPSSKVPAPTVANPSPTQAFKVSLDERVKAFVVAYFTVTPPKGVSDTNKAIRLSTASTKQAVQPFATAQFLSTAAFGYALYGSPTDGEMLKSHTTISVKPTSGLTDAHIGKRAATGTVMVHFVKTDDSGTYEGDKPQFLKLVKQGNTWFVNAAPLT